MATLLKLASVLLLQSLIPGATAQSNATERFNVTAIGAANGSSTIECWQIARPFDVATDPGTIGTKALQLGNLSNLTLSVLPPQFDGGLHTAPFVQWVAFTAGLAVVSLPDSCEQAVVAGGKYGLIIAADVASVSEKGHITRYPGDTNTVALQIRMKDGVAPEHKILHKGACQMDEVSGL